MKRAAIFWFTGLSGAGKSTVAGNVARFLEGRGFRVLIIDGDAFRDASKERLGFSESDIVKNNARIAEQCRDQRSGYDVILVPIISPYAVSREAARAALVPGFYEIYFDASLECVAARDPKGLYRKARNREIDNLIGYSPSSRYEAPRSADLIVPTHDRTSEESSEMLGQFILEHLS